MLNSKEIENCLLNNGFRLTKNNDRIHEFSSGGVIVYVKTPGDDSQNDFVAKSPLVIHPRHVRARERFDSLPGVTVNWEARRRNSNMEEFPHDATAKSKRMFYGHDVDIDGQPAFGRLIAVLTGRPLPEEIESNQSKSETVFAPETVRQALVDARVGQGLFRQSQLDYWKVCAITGISTPALLDAAHIKPWSESNNPEKLDLYNGILLSKTLHAAFDNGLISFTDSGTILTSPELPDQDAKAMGVYSSVTLRSIDPRHQTYLQHHRDHIFRK